MKFWIKAVQQVAPGSGTLYRKNPASAGKRRKRITQTVSEKAGYFASVASNSLV